MVVSVVEVDLVELDAQRAGPRQRRPVVADLRLYGEQIDHSYHRPVGFLYGLQLIDHVFQWARQQQHVLEQQERVADGDHVATHQHGADDQRDDRAGRNGAVDCPPHPQERLLPADRAAQRLGAVLDESPHGMCAGSVRAEVLSCREPFLDPSVQPGIRTHLVGGFPDGPMPTADDDGNGRDDVHRRAQGQSPVDHEQHADHADHREQGTGGTGNDPAHEIRHRCDVAIDTLDELTRGVLSVEAMTEPQHVSGHVDADAVGRVPRGDRGHPGHSHVDQLGGDGHNQEQHGQTSELCGGGPCSCLVDDLAHDQWPGQDQRRPDGDERADTDPTPRVGSKQRRQGAPTRCLARRSSRGLAKGRNGHRNDSSRSTPFSAPDFPNSLIEPPDRGDKVPGGGLGVGSPGR